MKQLIIILTFLITMITSCKNDKSFKISGIVPNTDSGAVRLLQLGESFFDSKEFKLKDSKFEFDGTLDYPEEFNIIYEKSGSSSTFQSFKFFVDPGSKIRIILYPDSIKSSKITGGQTNEEYLRVESLLESKFQSQLIKLENLYNMSSADSKKQDSILKVADIINKDIQNWKLDYIKSNIGSIVSANLLFGLLYDIPDKTIKDYFKLLDKKLENSKYFKSVEKYLSVLPGNHFVDFDLVDSSRTSRKFSELSKNKVTLIDFWASWCNPCRIQNKSLVKIYDQFHKQGFEIVGVSIDRDTSLFKSTIVKDKMTWVNLIDVTSQESVSKTYRSNNIPANFLIDNKGIIIAKDVPINKLYSKIDSLLKL